MSIAVARAESLVILASFNHVQAKLWPQIYKIWLYLCYHTTKISPECVVCLKTLCNAVMKPNLLKRHLVTNHSKRMNVDESYFQRSADNVSVKVWMITDRMRQKSADVVAAS